MNLGALKRVPLRDVWKNEERDFSKWLVTKDGMTLLSEAVGIELELVERESSVGRYELDVLAKIQDSDKFVAIENQIEDSNHDHLGKLITYAAGKNASCAIWIVSKARDEHRRAVEFLNATSKNSIGYFLLEIEAWKIGDSDPAPKFNVVESPNDWARNESDNGLTENEKLCLKFWTEFSKFASEQKEFMAALNLRKPMPQNWCDFSIGKSGVWLTASASTFYKTLRVGICVESSFEFYDQILGSVDAMSKSLGAEIECGNGQQIKVLKISMPFVMSDGSKWNDGFRWMCEKLVQLKSLVYANMTSK